MVAGVLGGVDAAGGQGALVGADQEAAGPACVERVVGAGLQGWVMVLLPVSCSTGARPLTCPSTVALCDCRLLALTCVRGVKAAMCSWDCACMCTWSPLQAG